jgi:hypothetical protein
LLVEKPHRARRRILPMVLSVLLVLALVVVALRGSLLGYRC